MGSRTVVVVLLLWAALGLIACDSGGQGSGGRASGGEENRTVTRVVTVREPAPSETTVVTETTGIVEADVESPSPCGDTPAETLALQYRLINVGDYEGAYALFAERSKQVISPEQYRTFFEANTPYSVTDYSFPSVDIRGDAATIQAVFTVTGSTGQEFLERTQELVCEASAWLVVMREEQAVAFAEAASEPQYEVPEPRYEASEQQYDVSEPRYEAPESQYELPDPEPQDEYESSPASDGPTLPGGDVDCPDFNSSAEAQPYLLPGDPYNLDADGDGQACDSLD